MLAFQDQRQYPKVLMDFFLLAVWALPGLSGLGVCTVSKAFLSQIVEKVHRISRTAESVGGDLFLLLLPAFVSPLVAHSTETDDTPTKCTPLPLPGHEMNFYRKSLVVFLTFRWNWVPHALPHPTIKD